ncbi:MAG TPA: glycine transferase [Deltaproteobacteria bacterium]|nr:glycine transferase [Deltaproteobacteria bacterium]
MFGPIPFCWRMAVHVALMQPYLFPYAGYFGLVHAADVFVLFDNVQYHRRGWMHRNRVHHPTSGWRYVGVPVVKAPRDAVIRDIRLKPGWQDRLLDDIIAAYRGQAQKADAMLEWLTRVLDVDTSWLHEVNRHTLEATAKHMGLPCRWESATDLMITRDPDLPLWDWARQACGRLDGTAYLNLPGGEGIYPSEPFVDRGLGLGFIQPRLEPYDRGAGDWEAGLSILDVIAHCGAKGAGAYAAQYGVLWTVAQPGGD